MLFVKWKSNGKTDRISDEGPSATTTDGVLHAYDEEMGARQAATVDIRPYGFLLPVLGRHVSWCA